MDLGYRVSYEVLEPGTPVFSSDEQQIGTVTHVLAAEHEDLFEGIVIAEHHGRHGHRFADVDDVDDIYERGVVLKLDAAACEQLHEPSANPAVMHDDPAEAGRIHGRLRRSWDMLSGNY